MATFTQITSIPAEKNDHNIVFLKRKTQTFWHLIVEKSDHKINLISLTENSFAFAFTFFSLTLTIMMHTMYMHSERQ
jgi:hypothetical protein